MAEVEAIARGVEPGLEDTRGGERLLALDGSDNAMARRLVAGLALSWVFGASAALVTGAWSATLGVPAMLGVVGSLGVPSVVIGLVLARSELDARDAARAAVHGIATTGLVLGGLAPATLLYLSSSTLPEIRLAVLTVALGLAGILGLARMGHALLARVGADDLARRSLAVGLVLAFALFSGVLALRLWTSVGPALVALPVASLGGSSW